MNNSGFDVIVFGATSFVGQILARYLYQRHGADGELNWALAGRSQSKLESVRQSLGADAGGLPLVVADAQDEAALRQMCTQTRVIISTVGPYALYGSALVGVCAATGTDYVDLTGEVQWIRRMIDSHESAAGETGARIVHCCGFDSIPSDMGVYFHQQKAMEKFGEPATQIRMQVARIKGGASGGTVASMMNIAKEVAGDPALRKQLANPYLLVPDGRATVRQPAVKSPQRDPDSDRWLAPFVMATVNTRIVHRSNALAGYPYGVDFRYDEAMSVGKGMKGRLRATTFTGGLGAFMVGAAIPPTRWFMETFVLPKPGEGPSPQEQERGLYDLRFYGTTAGGHKLVTKVTGDRDPGYGSTAKMLGEAGVCLAQDIPRADLAGGMWTPATAFGVTLIDRLTQHAGMSFEVIE
ncbi:MAG: saccharopine dehydrogenase NADP-binding domain-containing protein [Gammaproteobacteria bacterium]|nr:saccharopine dehydrogenase NADP-binding domain-containing protein [Gammaproteobacteria bacterium]NNF61721.1 saccharopine dehydrogenase [Gammaproteobacteria bacterium]NNM19712.1 saccharopine dehydrogenase [Gammaproteobacteria bacterium]